MLSTFSRNIVPTAATSPPSLHLSDCSLLYSIAPPPGTMETDYIVDGSPTSQPSLMIGDPVALGKSAEATSTSKKTSHTVKPVDVQQESMSKDKEIESPNTDDETVIIPKSDKSALRPSRRTVILAALLFVSAIALLILIAAIVLIIIFVIVPAFAADPPSLPDPKASYRLPVCQEQFTDEEMMENQCPQYTIRDAFMM